MSSGHLAAGVPGLAKAPACLAPRARDVTPTRPVSPLRRVPCDGSADFRPPPMVSQRGTAAGPWRHANAAELSGPSGMRPSCRAPSTSPGAALRSSSASLGGACSSVPSGAATPKAAAAPAPSSATASATADDPARSRRQSLGGACASVPSGAATPKASTAAALIAAAVAVPKAAAALPNCFLDSTQTLEPRLQADRAAATLPAPARAGASSVEASRGVMEAPVASSAGASACLGSVETSPLEAQLRRLRAEVEAMQEQHRAQVSQTETALVEVCKSLGMQQQQLEQQEMCTGMIHKLVQAGSEVTDFNAPLGAAVGASIESISTRTDKLQLRTEGIESSLAILQKSHAELHEFITRSCSGGAFVHESSKASCTLPTLDAAHCPLADLLTDKATTQGTSAGSSPLTTNSKGSVADDISSRVLVPLRLEVEMLCKDARESLELALREDFNSLQGRQLGLERLVQTLHEEHQASLATQAAVLRGELEATRGEAVSAVMKCWQELQQNPGLQAQEANAALASELEAQIQDISQEFRTGIGNLREEMEQMPERKRLVHTATLEASENSQARQLSLVREELTGAIQLCGNAELQIQHKELFYLVNVQQNLLSQHAEELEALRQEQQAGLHTVTSFLRQKLDTLSELGRILDNKVSTPQPPPPPEPVQACWPETLQVAQLLRQELRSVSGGLQREIDSANQRSTPSGWPMLQKKLSDLTVQVNDIGHADEDVAPIGESEGLAEQAVGDDSQVTVAPADARFLESEGVLESFLEMTCASGADRQPRYLSAAAQQASALKSADWRDVQRELSCSADMLPHPPPPSSSSSPPEIGGMPTNSLTTGTAWWGELQERHPDLARLVQTQRTELVRIVGDRGCAATPLAGAAATAPSLGLEQFDAECFHDA